MTRRATVLTSWLWRRFFGSLRSKTARLYLLIGMVCLACPIFFASPTRAQNTAPDLRTYEGWLREAFTAAQRRDRLGLEEIAPQLITTTSVQLPDDATAPVDNRWLDEALTASEPDFPLIADRLGALIDALALPDTSIPANAQQGLRDMLSRPPFAAEEESRGTLLGRLLDWLFDLLDRLFSPFDNVGSVPGNAIGQMIVIVGGLLVVGVLIYWGLGLRRSLTPEAQIAVADDPEANLTANSAFQQASNLARGGDHRTAVRYLYLSSLLWLDERGLLRYDRALTNHEYLERLRDNAELRTQLVPIIETFDRVWYGYAPLDAQGFAAYQQQVERLRKLRGGA